MRTTLSRLWSLLLFAAVVLLPAAAAAQTPLPGELPEESRPWTWWLSWPIVAGAGALVLFLAVSYLRLSPRFYSKEEEPAPRPQPQYAGIHAPAYPAPAPQAAAPAQAPPAEQPAPAAEEKPAAAPAKEEAAEEKPAEEQPPEQKPAEEAPEEQPPEEKPAEDAPEQKPAAEEKPGSDDEVYERVLQEQLDKGMSPKVAEGRAKAAALKAAREKSG